ncbi:MAG: GIY-YIG nuclease family protein [Bacteroidetes bacterium]|nr:GIY-YIG nuclease family protein [Bacteroidota bacterium]
MGSLVRAQPGELKSSTIKLVELFCFYSMSFFIYILHSTVSNIYYVGYSEDVKRRLEEHNNPIRTKFTSKHLPWKLVCSFPISENRGDAMKAEKYIKKQKSRKYLELLIGSEIEQQRVAQLVRVPMHRD